MQKKHQKLIFILCMHVSCYQVMNGWNLIVIIIFFNKMYLVRKRLWIKRSLLKTNSKLVQVSPALSEYLELFESFCELNMESCSSQS